jgi:site-specific DNA-methyltransferase (adenine-specific)
MEWAKKIHITTEDAYKDLSQFEDDFFDLAVVDPPYGGRPAIDPKSSRFVYRAERGDYIEFENVPPPASYFDELRRVSKRQIIWGINYFSYADLPSSGRIVWNKGGKCFGQGEIAYYSESQALRFVKFTFRWNGMLQGDMKNKEIRIHPTQKPVALYSWIFHKYAQVNFKILDTHGGSLSSAIAWHKYSKGKGEFIGVELDKEYYDEAYKRFKRETAQLTFF